MMASAGKRRVLIIIENLPAPFDRRVWQEAMTLTEAGYLISIICPTGKGYEERFQEIEGIAIYRYSCPIEADTAIGYLFEYSISLFWQFVLSIRVAFGRGFDVIHACNPPDTIFLIGAFYKVFGKRFVFDHHDINPELYLAKYNRRDFFYRLMILLERLTFKTASVSIATNESYKKIAIERGKMNPEDVFVVRSGPNLDRLSLVPPDERLKRGKKFLVGYVGVMGKQEGLDCLLRVVQRIVNEYGRKDIQFGLVGGGTELLELKDYAKSLGVADYVSFTGRVPDSELLTMLSTADICVNPDIPNEMNDKSTMNKIMEYMALGKPIVQFDLAEGRYSAQGASLYAVHNDEQDFALKLLELVDDAKKRKQMGELGRRRIVQELSWQHEVPKLLRCYDAAFDESGSTQRI